MVFNCSLVFVLLMMLFSDLSEIKIIESVKVKKLVETFFFNLTASLHLQSYLNRFFGIRINNFISFSVVV